MASVDSLVLDKLRVSISSIVAPGLLLGPGFQTTITTSGVKMSAPYTLELHPPNWVLAILLMGSRVTG